MFMDRFVTTNSPGLVLLHGYGNVFERKLKAGENKIRIAKLPNFTPLQGTILGWEVADIESVARQLAGRGVTLQKFPFAQDRELGIWTTPKGDKVAWFKDPDGNILSVSQHTS